LIVVDASIAVKWLLWERDSADALSFLRRHGSDLLAPDTIITEVAGALVRQANMEKALAEPMTSLLERWLGDWGDAAVSRERISPSRLKRAAGLAMTLGHPLPDCIYLAMAIDHGCDLATADAKFAVRARSIHGKVRLLADYGADA
jgi:predicted nucleic acid-binding protein